MNRIYSNVWNRKLGRMVVASELATSDRSGGRVVVSRVGLRTQALAVLVLAACTGGAMAVDAVCVDPANPGTPVGQATGVGDNVACGQGAVASGGEAIAIGARALGSGTSAVAVGPDAQATTSSAVAVGDDARATGLTATAIGFGTRAAGEYSVALGSGAQALGNLSYALGNDAQAREGDVAVGAGALTGSTGSNQTTAIGFNSGFESIGAAESTFIGATAGNHSNGQQNSYVGFGAGSSANGDRNVHSGYYTGVQATGNFNVASGNYALAGATGDHNVVQGTVAGAMVSGEGNVSIGYLAGTLVEVDANGNPDPTTLAPVLYNNAVNIGSRTRAMADGAIAIGSGATVTHVNSIAFGAGSATTVGAQASYQGAYVGTSSSTGEMNIGGRQVTGVAAGSADTDAVNVSQLQGGVTQAVTTANAYTDTQIDNVNVAIGNLDNRVTAIEGDLVDIRGDITDIRGDIVDIQGDVNDLGDRVTTVEGDVAGLTTTVDAFDNRIATVEGDVSNVQNGADGMFQISQEGPVVKPMPTGTNASAGGNGAVASGDNALAVGNQSTAGGANSTALGTGASASATGSTAVGQGASATHGNSVALGAGSATTVGAQANYNAAYVGNSTSTGEVNMGGRTISGVAPGIAGTDAVNVNQLSAGVNRAVGMANQYTDQRLGELQNDMWTMNRGYRGATASAMAMAGLPQAYLPGKNMLAVGIGGYQSEYGMAVGLSGITDNGRYVYKASASGNTSRDWGFSVGAGIQW